MVLTAFGGGGNSNPPPSSSNTATFHSDHVAPGVDYQAATRFLRLLDPNAKKFTTQTFHDKKGGGADESLARSSPSRAELLDLYARGAGVYVTISETDGSGRRKAENIKRIRAVFQEDDRAYDGVFPIEPSIIVQSSRGRFQRYWLIADQWPADEQGCRDFTSVMDRMIETYDSDKGVKDTARVLRLPGFLHRKDLSRPFMVHIVEASGKRYTRNEILRAFPPVEREKKKPQQREFQPLQHREFQPGDCDEERVVDTLRYVVADEYFIWLQIGMALKDEFGDRGRPIWDDWSKTSVKFNESDQEKTWRALRRHGITIATVFFYAKQNGWRPQPLSESRREIWRAAGITLRRWEPPQAREIFSRWSRDQGVNEVVARAAFETLLKKEARRVRQ